MKPSTIKLEYEHNVVITERENVSFPTAICMYDGNDVEMYFSPEDALRLGRTLLRFGTAALRKRKAREKQAKKRH